MAYRMMRAISRPMRSFRYHQTREQINTTLLIDLPFNKYVLQLQVAKHGIQTAQWYYMKEQ